MSQTLVGLKLAADSADTAHMDIADQTSAAPLPTNERWTAMQCEVTGGWDVLDQDTGVICERVYSEPAAQLIALCPDLIRDHVRMAPFSDTAHKVRQIIGEDAFQQMIAAKT